MKTKHWSIKVGNCIYPCEIYWGNIAYFYGEIPNYIKREGNITREDIRKHISKYKNENS